MGRRVISIQRISSRTGVVEEPTISTKGYQLADPAHGSRKHHAEHAVHVRTLEEAAELIDKGFSLWMCAKGKRASLIAPRSLRIVRCGEGGTA